MVAVAVGASGAWAAPKVVALAKNSVGSPQLKANAVTSAKIAPKSVGANDIAPGAVTSAAILNGSVGSADLGAASVTSEKLAAGSVNLTHLGPGSVTASAIAPGAVGSSHIADGSIGSNDIIASGIGTSNIADTAVTSAKLAPNSVTADKIAPGTIGVLSLSDGQVATAKLAADAVTGAKILDATITSSDLATDSVGLDEIAPNAVNTTELALGAVDGPRLGADSITSPKIVDGTLTSADIANLTIANVDIAPGAAIAASKLAAGTDGQVLTTTAGTAGWADAPVPGERTLLVPVTGSPSTDGQELLDANADIGGLGAGEWTIQLEAGVYEVPTILALGSKVNIRGAGSGLTIIRGAGTGDGILRTDNGASATRIESVTLDVNDTSGAARRGLTIAQPSGTAGVVRLRDVSVTATVGDAAGSVTGMFVDTGAVVDAREMDIDLVAGDELTGVAVTNATVDLDDTEIRASATTTGYGLAIGGASGSTVTFDDGDIVGEAGGASAAVHDVTADATVTVTDSRIEGLIEGAANGTFIRHLRDTVLSDFIADGTAGAAVSCSGVDIVDTGQYAPLDEDCQLIP